VLSAVLNLETAAKVYELGARGLRSDFKIDDQLHVYREVIRHWYRFERDDMREVCSPQPHGQAERTQSQTGEGFVQTCQTKPHFLTCIFTGDEPRVFQ
jgi:hypothetical protein